MSDQTQIPIACDLTAIPADARQQHVEQGLLIYQAAQEVQELADGFAFRFAPEMFLRVAHSIDNERRCCPFFAFALELEPGGGPFWLRITGGDDVKEFARAVFSDVTAALAQDLIHVGEDAQLASTVTASKPQLAAIIAKASDT